jgi:hypothetical protein
MRSFIHLLLIHKCAFAIQECTHLGLMEKQITDQGVQMIADALKNNTVSIIF